MTYLIILFVFIFGALIGSFLNCLIWRLPRDEWPTGRSYCPKCKKQIAWYDNIPVLSFLILRGECRECHKKISWQYPLIEMVVGVLFVISFVINYKVQFVNHEFLIFNLKFLINMLRDWFLISVMVLIFMIDLKHFLILDIVALPSALLVFLLNIYLNFSWQNLLISGIIGSSFFLIQFIISQGKWIGGGDIRLGLLMGLALGWPNIIVAILLAYFMGSIIGVGLIISRKKEWSSQVPLGTFLSIATIITLFWGKEILSWYINLL